MRETHGKGSGEDTQETQGAQGRRQVGLGKKHRGYREKDKEEPSGKHEKGRRDGRDSLTEKNAGGKAEESAAADMQDNTGGNAAESAGEKAEESAAAAARGNIGKTQE